MRPAEKDPEAWRKLGETLDGHLKARARGLLASEFVLLDRKNTEIGRLRIHGKTGADVTAGGVRARIERAGRSGYKMLSRDAEILTSTKDPTSPEITSRNRPYRANSSLLRNRAEAGPAERPATIRVRGGLANRNYELSFEPDDKSSLPVALFLLYRLISQRREAYATG